MLPLPGSVVVVVEIVVRDGLHALESLASNASAWPFARERARSLALVVPAL